VSGNLQVASAASLGAGPITLDTGRLQLTSSTTYARNVVVNQSSFLDVGAFSPTVSGVVSTLGTNGTAPVLTKTGTGTLTLTGNNTYAGGFTVAGGGLTLKDNGRLPNAAPLTLASG